MIRSSRLDLAPAATNEARLRAISVQKTLSRVGDEEDIGRNKREQYLSLFLLAFMKEINLE